MVRERRPSDPETEQARQQLKADLTVQYGQIGERLAEIRDGLGLSQEKAATKAFGRGKGTLSAWEKGRRQIGAAELGRLAKTYSVSCDYLIFGGQREAHLEAAKLVQAFVQLEETTRKFILQSAEDQLTRQSAKQEAEPTTTPQLKGGSNNSPGRARA